MQNGLFWYQNSANRLFSTRRGNRVIATILACFFMLDLRCGVVACKLFTCCRSARRVPSSGWFPVLLVWWWFENSRACLYYFFIVNDCQFIVSLVFCGGVPREGLNDGGVF